MRRPIAALPAPTGLVCAALACAGLACVGLVAPARAAEHLKVGFITTFSGTEAASGQMELDAFNLAIKHFGGTLGGLPVDIITGDDDNKTDTAIQVATKMAERDHVDVFTGPALTTSVLGVEKVARAAHIPYISSGPGPSQFAGKGCEPWFFGGGWQNDVPAEVTGQYMTERQVPDVYLIAPQMSSGRDMLAGFKRYYKGKIDGEKYTQMSQLDFAAEIADIAAAKPSAVFFFYPAGMGANFIQQWNQAGLKDKIPLSTMNSLDQITLPALGDLAVGIPVGAQWLETVDSPQNREFVGDFVATYKKLPSKQAAAAYMTGLIIDAAVKAVHGDLANKTAFRDAIHNVRIPNLTGEPFHFGPNNMPVLDYYVATVARGPDGADTMANPTLVFKNQSDSYVQLCKMPAN